IVIASFAVASTILAEASLSFLGLGVPPDVPTWGGMVAAGRDYILSGQWWMYTFPGIAIMLTVLGINTVGDWLRDYLDPRLHVKRPWSCSGAIEPNRGKEARSARGCIPGLITSTDGSRSGPSTAQIRM